MTPSLPRTTPLLRRRRLWMISVLGLLCLAGGAGWWFATRSSVPAAPSLDIGPLTAGVRQDQLNLILITMDTTRADHLGVYGAKDVKTPVLDRLGAEGVVFDQTMTTAPLTLPAHTSIFTGRFPPEHGARDNGGFLVGPEQITLAEILKARGFATAGFPAAYVLDSKWGIDQGFDTFVDDFDEARKRGGASAGDIQRPGNQVIDKVLPWLDGVGSRRFFAWVHLYDPHTPYAPPEPFKGEYPGHPYRGEVAFMDAQIGRLVSHLESRGLLGRTIIVAMGDHGESLGEHGEEAHGFFIYESSMRVPFIIRSPYTRTVGRHVADPVRVVDMMPTVLDLLGVADQPAVSGTSLVPLMTAARSGLDLEGFGEAMYPLHHYGWSDLRALRAGRYKLIDAPRPELYDLAQDPHETTNLFESRRTLADQMVARVRQLDEQYGKAAPISSAAVDVDPEVRSRLAALGYVGSFVADASDRRTDRADPKDKIGLFNLMASARDAAAEKGGVPRAIAMFDRVLRDDPNVIDAWFSLGNLLFRERRYTEAIERYSKALALKPDYDLAVINIAAAYRNLGNDDAALAGFERYLQIDPRDPYVRYQVGEIYLDRGQLDRAESEFRQALAIDDKVAQAKNALGAVAFHRGDMAAAQRLASEALATKPDVRLAHYNLALIAEKRGDLQLAEKEYLLELEQHPDAFKAAFNLSQLYAQIGERDLELDALRQAIDGNPDFAPAHAVLARAYVERRMLPQDVERLARRAISLAPTSEAAALAHAVLAQHYERLGRRGDAAAEMAAARRLERRP